jgi:hypothetical protein
MAGDIKQTTAIKEIRNKWEKQEQKVIVNDASTIAGVVTVFEDSTTKTMRQGTKMAEDAFSVFDAAYRKMISREIEVEKRTAIHTSKLKDKAGQIFDALSKIEKLTGPDFEIKLLRLERFANAVDTLDKLNKTGKLAEVSRSIAGLN